MGIDNAIRHLVGASTLVLSAGLLLSACTRPPEKLVEDLGDSQTLVQEKARQALREMGGAAVPYLLDGVATEAARTNVTELLIQAGDPALEPTLGRLEQHCDDPATLESLLAVVEQVGNAGDMLDAYTAATREGRCTEKPLLLTLLALEPPKDDVTVNIKENLRYKPVRFAYKAKPDLASSKALARLCLYDEELGWKVSGMNRDKDEQVYWDQWRMKDPLVRANIAVYLDDVIWSGYYENLIPDILREEAAEDAEHAATKIGQLATGWRKRLNAKAATPLVAAHAAVKTHYAANPGLFDEECLCYHAIEQIAEPIRPALDKKNRKNWIQTFDEALAAVTADREATCQAVGAATFMDAPTAAR